MRPIVYATGAAWAVACLCVPTVARADTAGGTVRQPGGTAISGARVTVVNSAGTFFKEVRTDASGTFVADGVPAGSYQLGASSPGRAYQQMTVTIAGSAGPFDFQLGPESERGRWTVIGDAGERLGGTNSGVLMPDGRIIYCHDTQDPVVFDPVTGGKAIPPKSPKLQGCHAVTAMPDGRIIYVGGADVPVYGPGTRQVKTFDPMTFTWTMQPDMNDYRWYPSMAQLPDGELLAIGGGGPNNPVRVKTSEVMSPTSMRWSFVGDVAVGNEVSPIVLLYSGEVLMTHRPPQLYNAATKAWRLAADFVQGPRTPDGDHADHEMVLLPDGRVVAIGFKTYNPGVVGNLTEIYDPSANRWRLGANFAPVRSRASILLLPGKKVLVMGGQKEQTSDPTPVNAWGYMALTDLYDPEADLWRRLADLNIAREYHAMPILVPDGRVFMVGGEGEPGNEPPASTIEAFTPPYLLRGPRPEISSLSKPTLRRGESFTFDVAKTAAPTRIVLISTIATTHFMDSGNNRYLELPFSQSGSTITTGIPTDPNRAPVGYYMLFAMVDDIPSAGWIVRVVLGAPPSMDGGVPDASGSDAAMDAPGGDRPGSDAADAAVMDAATRDTADAADASIADTGPRDSMAMDAAGGDSGVGSQDSAPDGTNTDAMPAGQDASTDSTSTDAQAPVVDSGADVGGADSGAGGRDGDGDASGSTSGAGCGCALAETRTPPTAVVLGLLAALLLRRRRVAPRPIDLSQGKEEAS